VRSYDLFILYILIHTAITSKYEKRIKNLSDRLIKKKGNEVSKDLLKVGKKTKVI
jgi:hypothetical protein